MAQLVWHALPWVRILAAAKNDLLLETSMKIFRAQAVILVLAHVVRAVDPPALGRLFLAPRARAVIPVLYRARAVIPCSPRPGGYSGAPRARAVIPELTSPRPGG
jgi:hypothetical protein